MCKILVIEDIEDIRLIVAEILSTEQYQVFEAFDGEMGVKLAQIKVPDLIICDLFMPKLDGIGVLTQLRQSSLTRNIPFLFLTAQSEHTHFHLSVVKEINNYLQKPFTRDNLLRAVTNLLKF
jgi:CheY-like chemotaxis protein